MSSESFEQLGKFIYKFQIIESQVNELLVTMAQADDEMVKILINEFDFCQRIKTADVMFARFVDVRRGIVEDEKLNFHKLMVALQKLSERRNELVHSRYFSLLTADKRIGLLRQHSRLRGSSGTRMELEEILLPENFKPDFERLNTASTSLEETRLKLLDWQFTDATT